MSVRIGSLALASLLILHDSPFVTRQESLSVLWKGLYANVTKATPAKGTAFSRESR